MPEPRGRADCPKEPGAYVETEDRGKWLPGRLGTGSGSSISCSLLSLSLPMLYSPSLSGKSEISLPEHREGWKGVGNESGGTSQRPSEQSLGQKYILPPTAWHYVACLSNALGKPSGVWSVTQLTPPILGNIELAKNFVHVFL